MSITLFAATTPGGSKSVTHTNSAAEPFRFPGGEWHLRVPTAEAPAFARVTGCDANDLVVLGLWADWVHSLGHRAVAHLPYLPAARADRGTPFGAQVYANLINTCNLDEVVVFDPHSPVAPSLINNVRIVESTAVIAERVIPSGNYEAILAPDAGAVHRAQLVADRMGLPLFTATKSRDFDTGKLTGFHAPENLPRLGRVLVVDDICDGGGTFMGLAKATGLHRDQLDLWVSHGIFSGRAPQLRESYGTVFTTDSHPGAANPEVAAEIIELAPYLSA
ncbi:ribose-phosphate pyrophosphokinase [Leucobacter viscericola]|uniref:Ribose-phosphate pyrophosphokinase n=1 Tax=Leucobacter viscericola TaxID=2714935 RepID=A0A6G7XFP7_9MICO|nr:phosphoribosyltransferase family protein [Leucobacter viscericola]QIK63332.1 ribose-phosphate pyrophosphokinase [Leucobacter viscericola]